MISRGNRLASFYVKGTSVRNGLTAIINPLSTNPKKWSNTLKQFVGNCQKIVLVCLTILWVWCFKINLMWSMNSTGSPKTKHSVWVAWLTFLFCVSYFTINKTTAFKRALSKVRWTTSHPSCRLGMEGIR